MYFEPNYDIAVDDVQERDAAVSRQRELVSEVCELKSRLDTMTQTCRELRLKSTSPEVTRTGSVEAPVNHRDEESAKVLKEKMAEMLSDGYVTVEPCQHSILKHLRLLVDSIRSHRIVSTASLLFVCLCGIYCPTSKNTGSWVYLFSRGHLI